MGDKEPLCLNRGSPLALVEPPVGLTHFFAGYSRMLAERQQSATAMKRATGGTADRPITLLSDSDEAELQEQPSKQARRCGAAKGKAREQQDARAAAAAMATQQAAVTVQQKAQDASVAAERAKTQASADEAAVAVAEERHARASAAAESACAEHRVAGEEKAVAEAALATARRRLADAEAREQTAHGAKQAADAKSEDARRARGGEACGGTERPGGAAAGAGG